MSGLAAKLSKQLSIKRGELVENNRGRESTSATLPFSLSEGDLS